MHMIELTAELVIHKKRFSLFSLLEVCVCVFYGFSRWGLKFQSFPKKEINIFTTLRFRNLEKTEDSKISTPD